MDADQGDNRESEAHKSSQGRIKRQSQRETAKKKSITIAQKVLMIKLLKKNYESYFSSGNEKLWSSIIPQLNKLDPENADGRGIKFWKKAWANQVAYAKSNERKGSLRKGKEASEIHEQILQLERNKILGDANARETGESDLPNFVNDSGAFQSLQNRVQTALQGTNIPEPRLDPDHFNRNPGQLDNELGNVSPSIPDINSGALIAPETGNFQNSPSNSINDQREETTKKVQEEIQHFNRIPAKHSQQNLPVNQGLSNAQMKKPMMNEENTDPNKIPAATIRENILVKKGTVPDAQKFIVTNYSVRELELMEELRRYKERNDFLQEKNEKLENDLGYQRHQNDILLEIIRNYSVHGK